MVKAYFLMDGGDEKMKFDDSDWLSKNGYKWAQNLGQKIQQKRPIKT